jgi:hypothetical protein
VINLRFGRRPRPRQPGRHRVNRRAFLRGAGGVAIGLPFLESLPERSAWAAGENPVFSLFVCAVDGIVPASFFPALGPLTREGLSAADKATSKLSAHAENLLFVHGINWPFPTVGEPHAETLCMALTAAKPVGTGNRVQGGGPSADWVIANRVQPGTAPLTLYAGNRKNGYIAERLSFSQAETVTAAVDNPYTFYQQLVGLLQTDGSMTPDASEAERLLIESRNSIHDLVRDDLRALMANPRMSSIDRQRLQQHFDAIRDIETSMGGMGNEVVERCSSSGLELSNIEAMAQLKYDPGGMTEDLARLHLSLVALAFACNYNRVATLQWGDGTDHTVYQVPSNDRQWNFNYISHRNQSDGNVGNDPLAAQAHAEIDVVRMQTLAAGLDHFKARGLEENSQVLWTNAFEDGPGHSIRNVPHIIWGSGGGRLKQAEYVDTGGVTNNRLLNTLITTAIQDTGQVVTDFGSGTPGLLDAILR